MINMLEMKSVVLERSPGRKRLKSEGDPREFLRALLFVDCRFRLELRMNAVTFDTRFFCFNKISVYKLKV